MYSVSGTRSLDALLCDPLRLSYVWFCFLDCRPAASASGLRGNLRVQCTETSQSHRPSRRRKGRRSGSFLVCLLLPRDEIFCLFSRSCSGEHFVGVQMRKIHFPMQFSLLYLTCSDCGLCLPIRSRFDLDAVCTGAFTIFLEQWKFLLKTLVSFYLLVRFP